MTTVVDDPVLRGQAPGGPHPGPGARPDGVGSGDEPGWTAALLTATGALLLVLVPVHLVGVVLRPDLDAGVLLDRWDHPGWLFADWALLLVGSVHGTVAVGRRLHRSRLPSTAQTALTVALGSFVGALFLWASWAMLHLV